jgi:tripartite-type tricarboxylate transporter receptor subunit TctC
MRQRISFGKYLAVVVLLMVTMGVFAGIGESRAEEAYPSRPIELIVPWGPGGGADQVARKVAHIMEPMIGVSIPVINVPGATGQTGLAKLLTTPADGYHMEVMTADTYIMFSTGKTKFKLNELAPVGVLTHQSSGFFVKYDAPWKTWADLEKAAKTQTLKVAITGFDSPEDMTVNYLAAKGGLKLVNVPYAKPGERYTSVIGGHADILYEQAGDVKGFVESKQLRPILFFADKRTKAFPDVPVSKEVGYNVTIPQHRILIMKAGTDPKHVKVISEALHKVAASAGFKEYLKEQYAEPDSYVPLQNIQKYLDDWTAGVLQVRDAAIKKK